MSLPPPVSDLSPSLLPVHSPRDAPDALEAGLRPSAVLVLLYPSDGEVTFVLTARPDTLSRHAGQISLPGGVAEEEDATLWDTAVREAREELGLRPGRVLPLGRLAEVTLRVSDHVITPFVGWNPVRPKFRPDSREVAAVLEVPLHLLLDGASVCTEVWEFRERSWSVTFYRFGEHIVWGATAMILHDLHARLDPSAAELGTSPGSVQPA